MWYKLANVDYYAFLSAKRRDPKNNLHKLAPTTQAPYKVTNTDEERVSILKMDHSVSCSRFLVVSKPKYKDGMDEMF